MQSARILGRARVLQVSLSRPGRTICIGTSLAAVSILAGCGMPGAPQPPSLNLPNRVTDLSAIRAGDQVSLSWKMPIRNTDKLLLKDNVSVRVCRNQTSGAGCDAVTTLQLAPNSAAAYTDA